MERILINSVYHTLDEWCEIVGKYYAEIMREIYDDSIFTENAVQIGSAEILSDLICWEGGVYADQAKYFIEMLYGVKLA